MKKTLALTLALAALTASAAVDVYFAAPGAPQEVTVTYVPISAVAQGSSAAKAATVAKTYPVANGVLKFELDSIAPAMYSIGGENPENNEQISFAEFYAQPGEDVSILVNKTKDGKYNFVVTGTDLLDGISAISQYVQPIEQNFALMRMGLVSLSEDEINEALRQYSEAQKVYIDINKDNPAAAYALLNMVDTDDFTTYLDKLGENAKKSILYPLVERRIEDINEQKAAEERMQAMQSGDFEAPDFTLPNENGEMVSLSQFRGKWVVLDFWGTWCRWCIKGIPAMKEAYAKHKGKAEFIGIDCGDSKEAWFAGLKQYEMPWVQVYTEPSSKTYNDLTEAYGIQGFPTKIVVNPEGKIAKVVVGEDPAFYEDLNKLVK